MTNTDRKYHRKHIMPEIEDGKNFSILSLCVILYTTYSLLHSKVAFYIHTLWLSVWAWLGEALPTITLLAGEPPDVCGDELLVVVAAPPTRNPLLVGDGAGWRCLGAPPVTPEKWLFGVDGREFVGVKQDVEVDNLCCTIFWHAVKKQRLTGWLQLSGQEGGYRGTQYAATLLTICMTLRTSYGPDSSLVNVPHTVSA